VQLRQLEMRRGLADERRGHFARIERETDPEQGDQGSEDGQGRMKRFMAASGDEITARLRCAYCSAGASPPPGSGDHLRRARRQRHQEAPAQIQSMKGLCCTLTSQAVALTASPMKHTIARETGIDRGFGHRMFCTV